MRVNPGAQITFEKQVAKVIATPTPSHWALFMTTLFILIDFIVFIYIGRLLPLYSSSFFNIGNDGVIIKYAIIY